MLLIVIEDARASLESEKHDVIYAGLIIFKLLKYFISGVIFKMTSQGESQVPVLSLK